MKRILSCLLLAAVIFSLLMGPVQASAATSSSKAGAVTNVNVSVNVRAGASTGTPIVTTLKKGSHVTLLQRAGSWWKVEYAKSTYGYCHADYIKVVSGSPATVSISSGSLNVRSGAGTSYGRVASLYKGETVLVLSSTGGWSRILYHGTKTGYVSAQYLASSGAGNVALNVPSFKQADSRWANIKIGTSGKTFAQIGCATTGIAMMESYRTGTTIYPHVMAQKLNYTASGNVYWPKNFVTVTSSSGYLQNILALLRQGKPVLLGAKNSYGGQHWVVINGFSGGTVTAANFSILDPGSHTRTDLQQFLSAYPTFYKYFYYQ